jgi:cyclin-dependent kinase 8/11
MLEDWSGTTNNSQNDPMRAYRAKRDKAHVSVKDKYNFLGFISSGTYGRVYKVQAKASDADPNVFYAVKKFKPDKEGESSYTGLSQSAVREIAVRPFKLLCFHGLPNS